MGKIPVDCPCTKDCPDRSPEYCKTCEKGIAYKNSKLEEYEKRKPAFEYMLYEGTQINRAARAAKDFKKGILK